MINRSRHLYWMVSMGALILTSLACGLFSAAIKPAATVLPQAPVAPIHLGGDFTAIDVCGAIPKEDIQAVMGRKLTSPAKKFSYYDTQGSSGCAYDAGKDPSGEAHFGYVAFTPVSAYAAQPLYMNVDVSGFGEAAFFNNGADARQLWVKVNDSAAFVVAFGDVANEAGDRAIAKLLLDAIR